MAIDQIKKLREETKAPVMEVKRALDEAGGEEAKAKKILAKKALVRAEQKKEREAGDGHLFAYIHPGGKVGVLLELRSETDFAAKSEPFQTLGKELTLQIASMNPGSLDKLLKQEYIRDTGRTVGEFVKEVAGTVGENVAVGQFVRYKI